MASTGPPWRGSSPGRGSPRAPGRSPAAARPPGRPGELAAARRRPGPLVLLRGVGDVALHAAEDDPVERSHRPPVELPQQAAGVEPRLLPEHGATLLVVLDGEVEPGETGQPHLGAEPEQPLVVHLLDAPPVDGVADPQVVLVAPAAPQPRASADHVEPAAHAPGRGPGV